jgi:hypothetical protein
MIVANFDQSGPAVLCELFRVSEWNDVVSATVQDDRARLYDLNRAILLPRWAQQDESRIATLDVHCDSTTPARSDDNLRAVFVEFRLSNPDCLGEVLVRQCGVENLVAVRLQEARLNAANHRVPTVEEQDFHRIDRSVPTYLNAASSLTLLAIVASFGKVRTASTASLIDRFANQ